MAGRQRIDRVRRQYNQWVANQTLEDYALRFTAKSARRWSAGQSVHGLESPRGGSITAPKTRSMAIRWPRRGLSGRMFHPVKTITRSNSGTTIGRCPPNPEPPHASRAASLPYGYSHHLKPYFTPSADALTLGARDAFTQSGCTMSVPFQTPSLRKR